MLNRENLTNWLKQNGCTLEGLADKAGVSNVTLSRILNGHCKPSYPTLEKLSKVTKLSFNELLKKSA
ncbi:MAG: helix-turn-helix domain-containing protein [Candidatus Xenobiia bacterium LiM19]